MKKINLRVVQPTEQPFYEMPHIDAKKIDIFCTIDEQVCLVSFINIRHVDPNWSTRAQLARVEGRAIVTFDNRKDEYEAVAVYKVGHADDQNGAVTIYKKV